MTGYSRFIRGSPYAVASAVVMRPLLIVLSLCGLVACTDRPSASTHEAAPPSADRAAGTTGTISAPDDSGDWVRASKDFPGSRYSRLDQITTDSVKSLGV